MGYTSIFASSGGLNSSAKTTFNYTPPAPVVPKFNLGSVKDVPTLNTALHSGQINQNQWMQRFKQLQSTAKGFNTPQTPTTPIQTGIAQNLNPFNKQSVVNQQDITPIKNTFVGAYQQARSQAQHLAAPTSTQAQRDKIMGNQAAVQQAENPQFNTKNPTGGGIVQRVKNDVVSAYQHVNPFSGVSDANKLIDQTAQQYGLTPNFVKTLQNANTSLTNNNPDIKRTGAQAMTYDGSNPTTNKIQISQNTPSYESTPQSVLIHEGLRQVWNNNPQVQKTFGSLVDKNATPDMKSYIAFRLQSYGPAGQAIADQYAKTKNLQVSKLSPTLQYDVHSLLASFYTDPTLSNIKADKSSPIYNYYSQYFNPSKAQTANATNYKKANNIPQSQQITAFGGPAQATSKNPGFIDTAQGKEYLKSGNYPVASGGFIKGVESLPQNLVNKFNNPAAPPTSNSPVANMLNKSGKNQSAQGLIQAEQMAKNGASPAQIKQFLQKDAQALDKQTKAGINTAATIAGFSAPGEGILAKGLGGALDKTGVIAAAGKDEATNALINSQKVANASKKVNLADTLGNSSVKGATTPKITKVPVEGESTAIAGKVTPKPADTAYIKASNKLSDQYEKELANVQSVPHPVTQKVLQTNLDTKYNALQQNLDDTYGKSSISFKGKPTTVKPTETTLPPSGLDKNPVTPFDSTRIPVQEESKAPSPAPTKTTSPTGVETKTGETPAEQGTKVSGSAINSEQRAVEKGLVSDLGEKATYTGGSYKQEAGKAIGLVNEQPDEAMKIATGAKPGDNTIHEVAVRRAVENKALQNNDVGTLTRLAQSPQHSATSEAAQRLGSEGFNANHNSPVQAIREISQARGKALVKGEQTVDKVTESTAKDIQKTVQPKLKVSRQDWHSFISDLQCK